MPSVRSAPPNRDFSEVRFVDNPLFSRPDAHEQLERLKPAEASAARSAAEDAERVSRRSPLGKLCEEPPLSREEERYLFLRMNFERSLAAGCSGKLRERHLSAAARFRNRIVVANFRLLVSIAGQFAVPPLGTEDLVSEGVLPLLRAVDLFDVSRGWAFGTYATHVLRNHFRRLGKRQQRKNRLEAALKESQLAEVPDAGVPAARQQELAGRHQRMVQRFLADLPDTDQNILRMRFGFDDPASPRLRSYAEVGQVVGLSKERVRVRAHQALEQLRETAKAHNWEFPELDAFHLHA